MPTAHAQRPWCRASRASITAPVIGLLRAMASVEDHFVRRLPLAKPGSLAPRSTRASVLASGFEGAQLFFREDVFKPQASRFLSQFRADGEKSAGGDLDSLHVNAFAAFTLHQSAHGFRSFRAGPVDTAQKEALGCEPRRCVMPVQRVPSHGWLPGAQLGLPESVVRDLGRSYCDRRLLATRIR